jgi:hypothetical protein
MARDFKKPNLTAPRYRPKVYNVLNEDLFKAFKEKHPKYSDLKYKDFKKIIATSNQVLWENVIKYRDGVELPESLGFIFIGTCEPAIKKQNIDYGKSIKSGITVSNQNWDSDGKLGKIFYTNYPVKYKVPDRQIWNFVPCRKFKRTVAKEYPENWTKYLKVPNNSKVSKMYYMMSCDHKKMLENTIKIDNYNEFEID